MDDGREPRFADRDSGGFLKQTESPFKQAPRTGMDHDQLVASAVSAAKNWVLLAPSFATGQEAFVSWLRDDQPQRYAALENLHRSLPLLIAAAVIQEHADSVGLCDGCNQQKEIVVTPWGRTAICRGCAETEIEKLRAGWDEFEQALRNIGAAPAMPVARRLVREALRSNTYTVPPPKPAPAVVEAIIALAENSLPPGAVADQIVELAESLK